MKQITLNVSEGVNKIEIHSFVIGGNAQGVIIPDELPGDIVTIDIDCSGKMELRKITPAEFAVQMDKIARECKLDKEAAHSRMDALMCRVLQEQGFGTGVQVFNMQSKGYV